MILLILVRYSNDNHDLGYKYKKMIEEKTETCDKSGGNQIFSEGTYSLDGCKRACDVNDDCVFFAHFITGWCKLFKSCMTLETVKRPATTYEKVKSGKMI